MMWFFPEGVVPITADNIIKAVNFARSVDSTPVANFSSVPYVLQLLADTKQGIKLLQSMDMVGVGGAALPDSIGNRLVELGIRLISRMGSAECGFLMSSERDFEKDKYWQYLRPVVDPEMLCYEKQSEDNQLSELVVRPRWPLRTKTNRNDGSYATADLFEPHPSIPNAWKYHSRADSQIALANGKKFDPAPLEGAILTASGTLRDVLVFGAGRDEPGALLLVKNGIDQPDEAILEEIWPRVDEVNGKSSTHAQLSRSMLVVKRLRERDEPLEKSSKGTIMRNQAEARYCKEIDAAYSRASDGPQRIEAKVSDEDVAGVVLDAFRQVLGRSIDPGRDAYLQGVDSIACTRIRKLLEAALMPAEVDLPLNVIYDEGTIEKLASHILRVRRGTKEPTQNRGESAIADMKRLASKYSCFAEAKPAKKRRGDVVVLTGCTGALGAHTLHLLLQDPQVVKIFCLVRAESSAAAEKRVNSALSERGMPVWDPGEETSRAAGKVVCVPCVLSEAELGISLSVQQKIVQEVSVFIHSAWAVNFSLGLHSFEDHIAGTRHLLDLARTSGASFYMISSTASVAEAASEAIPEAVSVDPQEAAPLGYAQSKWVAEQICISAGGSIPRGGSKDAIVFPEVAVLRVGQLCGNIHGIWNASEAYPLILSSLKIAGSLPDFGDEPLNWLPVDQAAQAVLEIALPSSKGISTHKSTSQSHDSTRFFHILNPHRIPTWSALLRWIGESEDGGGPLTHETLEVVRPDEWVLRLEKGLMEEQKNQDHPSQGLLGFWKQKYLEVKSDGGVAGTESGSSSGDPCLEVTRAQEASQTMRKVQPLDRESVLKMWKWVRKNVG